MAHLAFIALILALNVSPASARERSEYEASVITLDQDFRPSVLYCGGYSYHGGHANVSVRVLSQPGFSSITLTQINEKVLANPEVLFQASEPLTLINFLNAGAQYPSVVLPQAARDFSFKLNGRVLKPLMEVMPNNPNPKPSVVTNAAERLIGAMLYDGYQYFIDCSGAVIRMVE